MKKFILGFIFALCSTVMFSQVPNVTTSYVIPDGSVCGAAGPEACTFYPVGIPHDGFGRFQTGQNWTQLVFDSYDAEFCDIGTFFDNPSQNWSVVDTDIVPPPPPQGGLNQSIVKKFTMDCPSSTISGGHQSLAGHNVHAEIYAYSYQFRPVCRFRCGAPPPLQTRWVVVDGAPLSDGTPQPSFVEDVIPTTSDGSDPMPLCRPGTPNCKPLEI